MKKIGCGAMLAALCSLCGCMSQAQYLDSYQAAALSTAQRRAAFELNCNAVESTMLSRKIIEPVLFGGIQRAEYTIGVRGCGRQAVYWTLCTDSDNCNALAETGRVAQEQAP